MTRTVSIGVDSVPKYLYYIPIIRWAWNNLGWETFIFHVGESNKFTRLIDKTIGGDTFPVRLLSQYNYPSSTMAQVTMFYAYFHNVDFFMTSDSDMIPLSDYWKPKEDEITCYGRDLSNEHFPACYVAMSAKNWARVMGSAINQINFDLREYYPKAKNKWTVDQNILTDRLNKVDGKVLIDRGIDPKTNYPVGRVDRSSWTLKHNQMIDCHAPHDILSNEKSFHKIMDLLHTVWPFENFKWVAEYHKEFKKLL